MPRNYPVPLEIRGEEKILGNVLSGRQVIYIGIGVLIETALFFPLRSLANWLGMGAQMQMVVALAPLPLVSGIVCMMAFAPAGFMGILPGPQQPPSPDPFDPPLTFDQWIRLKWKFDKKVKLLPYRRRGYKAQPNPFDAGGAK